MKKYMCKRNKLFFAPLRKRRFPSIFSEFERHYGSCHIALMPGLLLICCLYFGLVPLSSFFEFELRIRRNPSTRIDSSKLLLLTFTQQYSEVIINGKQMYRIRRQCPYERYREFAYFCLVFCTSIYSCSFSKYSLPIFDCLHSIPPAYIENKSNIHLLN